MYRVTDKKDLNFEDYYLEVEAPHVTRNWRPGQFVMIMAHERGERIPMSIHRIIGNRIGMFIRRHGKTTYYIYENIRVGDSLYAVAGPLGRPLEIKPYGTAVVASDAVCAHAEHYEIARELKKAGNEVISIMSFPSVNAFYPEEFLPTKISDEIYFTTFDGSNGVKGNYIPVLKRLVNERKIDAVYAGGSFFGMRQVGELATKYRFEARTLVRQIMVDGTGMCGSCRIRHGERIVFVCRDGPWLDPALVDWDDVERRDARFRHQQKLALDAYLSSSR